jgi:hypothetical protein
MSAVIFIIPNGKDISDPTNCLIRQIPIPIVTHASAIRYLCRVIRHPTAEHLIHYLVAAHRMLRKYVFATSTGFNIKYINNVDFANIVNSGINFILVRYAEVLLAYAEAKIELGQTDQSVYEAINAIRQRSDVYLPPLSGHSQTELRDAVRRERTLELLFDGLRLFDIRRWRIAETVIPGAIQGITYMLTGQLTTVQVQAFEKVFNRRRDYLWPVPQKEKELNPGFSKIRAGKIASLVVRTVPVVLYGRCCFWLLYIYTNVGRVRLNFISENTNERFCFRDFIYLPVSPCFRSAPQYNIGTYR